LAPFSRAIAGKRIVFSALVAEVRPPATAAISIKLWMKEAKLRFSSVRNWQLSEFIH
jgi:hypothetical protein